MHTQLLQIRIHDHIPEVVDWNAYINMVHVRDDLVIELCERGIEATDGKFYSSFCIHNFKPFHETIINMLLCEHGPYWIEFKEPIF